VFVSGGTLLANGLAPVDTKGGCVSDQPTRFRHTLQAIGTIVAILGVAVPGGIWAANHLRSPAPGPAAAQTTAAAGAQPPDTGTGTAAPTTPAGTAAAAAPGKTVYLDSVAPDTGSTNLGPLPRALGGQPGYEHAVAIPCGTNSGSDTHRAVTYLLSRRYLGLQATVHIYKAGADETKVTVKAFPDNRAAETVTLTVGESGALSLDLADVTKLTLDVVCERPGATAVLAGAALQHA
jgi:hypothetical protein